MKSKWDLDESLFIAVYPTVLFLLPVFMNSIKSRWVLAAFILKSLIKTPLSGLSLTYNLALTSELNKSLTS
jgi:hypothetical protein